MTQQLSLMELPNYLTVDNHTITYVGIGSACYTVWGPTQSQQYPYCISQYKLQHPDTVVNLILIDPHFEVEKPPVCVKQYNGVMGTLFSNHYTMCQDVNVYVFPEPVKYLNHMVTYPSGESGVDLIPFCDQLNILHRFTGILIVHDFSGHEIEKLSMYYEPQVDRSRIIYDLSARSGISCLSDTDQLWCGFTQTNDHISLIHPLTVPPETLFTLYHDNTTFQSQIIYYIRHLQQELIDIYLACWRRTLSWINGSTIHYQSLLSIKGIQLIDAQCGTDLWSLLTTGQSQLFYETLSQLITQRLSLLATIYHSELHIMEHLINPDQPQHNLIDLFRTLEQVFISAA